LKKIYFIGIGGTGMSALALLLLARGAAVFGSDCEETPVTAELREAGVGVCIGHAAANVPLDAELVVASAAIGADNAERRAAEARGVRVVKYAEMLGMLMQGSAGIAVSGTHGKTTSTAMAAHALLALGADPTVVAGGPVPAIGGSSRAGRGEYFVAEACEYDRSFLQLSPRWALITNIEADHLDYYRDLDEIVGAFGEFVKKVPADGAVVVNADSPPAVEAVRRAACRVVTFGTDSKNDFKYGSAEYTNGRMRFKVWREGKELGRFSLGVPGGHNVANACGVAALLDAAGFSAKDVLASLEDFTGAGRRFELVAEVRGVRLYDDYAHHPTELEATLRAARECHPGARLWAVFQPHQYFRTRLLLDELARELLRADRVVIPPIFAARDTAESRGLVSAQDLVQRTNELGGSAEYANSLEEAADLCLRGVEPGDVVITLGAGDIYETIYLIRDALINDDK
jgi:UDP-N-acetylmuramate--alanine ligase